MKHLWKAIALLFLGAAGLAADAEEQGRVAVRLVYFHDLSEELEPSLMELGGEPKYFKLSEGETEKLRMRLVGLPGCRASVQIESGEVIGTEPKEWPPFFVVGSSFVVKLNFPRHREEVRGAVVGLDHCAQAAPNKTMEPTR